jgi:quinol monooxygenase YgiN
MDRPICVSVLVVVAEGRESEFLEVMRQDAIESRKEPGCMCFHVSAAPDPRTYMFYEVYADGDAVAFHKSTKHYAAWDAFRNGGGIERQHNTVCEGVFLTDQDTMPGSAARDSSVTSPGAVDGSPGSSHAAHGNASYDFESREEGPRRATRTQAPADFGHPRGLKEDPIRPGTLSNFGRRGVRHIKKASPHQISPSSNSHITNRYGGLGEDAEGLILPPGSARRPSEMQEMFRQMHRDNFDGFALKPAKPGDKSEFSPVKKPVVTSAHLEKNFDGMSLTKDGDTSAEKPRRIGGQQHEWSKQADTTSRFEAVGQLRPRRDANKREPGEVNDFPSRRVDKSLPWANQHHTGNFSGLDLTPPPDPTSPPRVEKSPFDSEETSLTDPFFNITTKRRVQQPLPKDAAGGSRTASTVRLTGSQRRIVGEMDH